MWKGMKVIDADAHMHEPEYLWERYVESAYQDRVPKVAFMDGLNMVYEPDGVVLPKGRIPDPPSPHIWTGLEEKYGEAFRQWWGPNIRLQDMDKVRLGHPGVPAHARQQRQLRHASGAQGRRHRRRHVPRLPQLGVTTTARRTPSA